MDRRAARQFWVALVLIPLMAGMAFAAGGGRYFVCAGDAIPRLDCCCPASMQGSAPAQGAAVAAACCCSLARTGAPAVPAASSSRDVTPVFSKLLHATVSALELAPTAAPVQGAFAASAEHPPSPAVPILLRKQSFLN